MVPLPVHEHHAKAPQPQSETTASHDAILPEASTWTTIPDVLTESSKRQVLVFAHIPPPHHGQSVMVELMLRGLQHDTSLSVFHVDARVSDALEDVGGLRVGKFGKLLRHCLRALAIRLRHGPMDLYYVPAPAKKSAIIRDWIVMILLRPWFSRTILHWHAIGLADWACGASHIGQPPQRVFSGLFDQAARLLTRLFLGRTDLSIILTEADRKEVSLLKPKRITVVPNGIPDPCPLFKTDVLPLKTTGSSAGLFRCLYLAHCTRDKGLFDAIEATCLANELLARQGSARSIALTIAGSFMNEAERREFQTLMERIPESVVRHVGFVSGPEKSALLRDHDCLVSFSRRETFGLNVVEALAFGMLPCLSPIPAYVESFSAISVIARSMSIPDLANALILGTDSTTSPSIMRAFYLEHFSPERFTQQISEALLRSSDHS